ncbi:hypothetical protein NQ315_002682 [Exocentrus adspersus]|uniref:CCHC-type domain-containing protein n=1 Tax=Exocentrus adspersus TaxID=1586481 RepID=A0AAV8VIQ0_9CUCU|nr:hypothetical protein NQ315_002682 [Exocentrus adspersus]
MSKRRHQPEASFSKRSRARQTDEPPIENDEVGDEAESFVEPQSRTSEASSAIDQLATVMKDVFSELRTSNPSTSAGNGGDTVPFFDPENSKHDINSWIDWFLHTPRYLVQTIKGLALTWYVSLKTVKYSWAQWKDQLKRPFPATRDYTERLDDMVKRRKYHGETYTRYYFEKLALINICGNISGREAVSCIIHGLPDDHVKASVRVGNYEQPEELFSYLRTLPSTSARHKESRWDSKMGAKGVTFKRHELKTKEIKCFKCGKMGHKSFLCDKNDDTNKKDFCGNL